MILRFFSCCIGFAISFGTIVATAAQPAVITNAPPADLKIVKVEAFPEAIQLTRRFDYRQLLLTGHLESGETVDVTRWAKLESEPLTVRVSSTGRVVPQRDGQEELIFKVADQTLRVSVSTTGSQEHQPVSFVAAVQPVFAKMGCNAGTCHGAKDGKNGFKLSLRGYDSLFDHRALTDDISARRFNRAAPDQSLILLKASGSIPHVGGVRTETDSPFYHIVRQWITEGARLDLDGPRVTSLEVLPPDPVLPRAGLQQQIVVLATYSDGAIRDVTREAFVESGNIEVATADETGMVGLLRRGEAPILVRYEGTYAATTLTVMGDRTGFAWQAPPVYNFIDQHVYDKLERLKILASDVCRDEDFLRRIHLDLTGLPPSADQVRAFIADPRNSRKKRAEIVDQLIGSPEYVEHWTNKWADLLQVNRKFLGEEGASALRNWVKQSVTDNLAYDEFAHQLLTASGSTVENPPAAYFKVLRDPTAAMENTTHLFLAIRFNCNKCHDHPFERWTQDQYYHLSAFFSQIGRKEHPAFSGQKIGGTAVEGATPLVEVVFDQGSGEVRHERTGVVAAPQFPYAHEDQLASTAPRRRQLAHWIVSPENPYFARSYVNRLWGYLFGRGIIEPIDDIRAGNPPTNPALLDALTDEFIANDFDVQHMLRTICTSRTYQHAIETNRWNEDDQMNGSHALPRRLPAEVLYDLIHVATGSTSKIPGLPPGLRAAEIPDAGVKVPFLDDLGRPARESACECERSTGLVLGPIMKLVNGPTVAQALADPGNALGQLVAAQPDDNKVVEEMFLRFLCRYPSEEETRLGVQALQARADDPDASDPRLLGAQDLAWALINNPAFLFNR